MSKPIQTNLDEIYLEEIKTSTINRYSKSNLIHFADGKSIEVGSDGNFLDNVKVEDKVGLRQKKLRLFQLISSPPIDHFVNISSGYGKKTLKKVDNFGNAFASIIGITSPKYSSEISSATLRKKTNQ